ncbi:MAG: ribonuclease P protein component 4 [Nanoarchaeota archaeon]
MGKPLLSKTKQNEIAEKRIRTLFAQAQEMFPHNTALANRYVSLARKIAMKVKTKIPLELKRRYCKHCYRYLLPGVNARVRTRQGKVVISCLECKKFMRIPLK